MMPEIIEKEGFTLVGVMYEGKNQNNEIITLWDNFIMRLKEIKNRIGSSRYGYDTWTEKINETGEFIYVAGVEVEDDSDVPEGMVSIKIPSNRYAVFTIDSVLEDVHKTVGEIFSKWLPKAGLKVADNYDFEYYNENFKPDDHNSKIYFYVPIK
ncbi:GyrI-like domain-containing protein [Alkaliphilus peptidifermentans]|uniref:AraC family transcriptional regulator n=1 Tax=Alkaliphilus peptidifermentans DSM 18978 TaxID=1120976 RepID=A0A1G5IB52_9FIRM|nr:GyrI-like domain-containing protein [Alkaliphilus peptidifermentans]SCY73011.1 AraC family transcriptional regulator [Alkaliphilus peptidifermentans DSM 18978]